MKWAYTYFPEEEENIEDWNEYLNNLIDRGLRHLITKHIAGEEYAPETKKRHFQGYIETIRYMDMQTLKNWIGKTTIHLENAKGNRLQNIAYCTKPNEEGLPEKKIVSLNIDQEDLEYKEKKDSKNDKNRRERESRMRTFLTDLRTQSMQFIEEEYPIQFYREQALIEKYRSNKQQGSETWNGELNTKNYWIHGKTGTGKSTWARKQLKLDEDSYSNNNIYFKCQNKWWDGYQGQQIVLIEDWNPGENSSYSKALLHHLKIWSDRFSFNAEIKGGSKTVFPGTFFLIVTSNHSIADAFYGCPEEDISAVQRRFHEQEILSLNDIFLQTELDPKILDILTYQ